MVQRGTAGLREAQQGWARNVKAVLFENIELGWGAREGEGQEQVCEGFVGGSGRLPENMKGLVSSTEALVLKFPLPGCMTSQNQVAQGSTVWLNGALESLLWNLDAKIICAQLYQSDGRYFQR